MKIIGVIPARYRSSRFPGKPLADICGRPMIWWVYRQAKKVEQLDAVYVATDDERIQAACESYGIPVVMTSPDHPTGSDRVAEVAAKVEGDLFINIQGDEPLMEPEMVRQVIRLFDDPEVYFGSLKKKITDPDLIAADSTVKVVTDDLNNAMYFSRNPIPSGLKDDFWTIIGYSNISTCFLGRTNCSVLPLRFTTIAVMNMCMCRNITSDCSGAEKWRFIPMIWMTC